MFEEDKEENEGEWTAKTTEEASEALLRPTPA